METRRFALTCLMLAALGAAACQTLPRPGFTQAELAAASPPYRYDFSSDTARARSRRTPGAPPRRRPTVGSTCWPCPAAAPTERGAPE
ncbi:hypothetical protein MU852_13745 [Brevundimonas albigilva]|uniref:hypothetical protein n=1 Tax=Brevundimonas albigilva TaxID=1312364 RepID=UPI00201B564E|nr:hypothetical protein [Brevundimonas albigilva]UQV17855.1 hypothetical protein MU852_13745 [Brevundimonas albigilva]